MTKLLLAAVAVAVLCGAVHASPFEDAAQKAQQLTDPQARVDAWTAALDLWTPADGASNKEVAYYDRGNAYDALGKLDAALADYDQAIALVPQADAYRARSDVKDKRGDLAGSMEDINKALALKPDYWKAYNDRGLLYGKLGKPELAKADLEKGASLSGSTEDAAQAWYNLATDYLHRKDYDRAAEAYGKAMALRATWDMPYMARGTCRYQQRRWAQALPDFDRALELRPANAEAAVIRGNVRYKLGKTEAAMSDYAKAAELKPDSPNPHYRMAGVHHAAGRADQAAEEMGKALELKSDVPAFAALDGWILLEAGKLDEAEVAFEKAAGAPGGSAYAELGAAALALSRQDPAKAKERWAKAVALQPKLGEGVAAARDYGADYLSAKDQALYARLLALSRPPAKPKK